MFYDYEGKKSVAEGGENSNNKSSPPMHFKIKVYQVQNMNDIKFDPTLNYVFLHISNFNYSSIVIRYYCYC